jgi:hypothetical protein
MGLFLLILLLVRFKLPEIILKIERQREANHANLKLFIIVFSNQNKCEE